MNLTQTSDSRLAARDARPSFTDNLKHVGIKAARSCRIAALALTLLPLAAASASASTTAKPCPQSFGSFTGQAQPAGCWRPYGPSSPFNTPIPAGARVAADSGAIVGQIKSDGVGFAGGKQGFEFDSQGSRPIYWSQPSDPLVTIHCTYLWGPNTCQGENGEVVDGLQIHIPANAEPEQQSSR